VIEETWEILSLLGVDKRRLRLKWISASEGAVFAKEIHTYVQVLRELGDNTLKEGVDEPAGIPPLEEVQKNRT